MGFIDADVPPDVHAMAAYFAEGSEEDHAMAQGLSANGGKESGPGRRNDIVFDARLGLAVEAMPEGVTMDSLWRVI